jgi:hemolysin activation/secretion protein
MGLGNWTFGLSGSYSEFLQPLTPDTELVGRSTILGLSADRLLYRSSTTKTNAVLTLDRKWFRRYVNDVSLIPQDLTVVRAGARGQFRSPEGILFADGVLAVGTTALGATEDPANLPTDAPHAQFTKFEAGVTWLGRIDIFSLRASLRGQYSLDALYSSEQIVLGGFYTVRGYGESVAFGDSGWYSRNELGIPLRPGTLVTDGFDWSPHIQPYVFLDGGQVFSKSGFFENSLGGAGVGLRLAKRPVSLDLTLAYPFIRNDLPRQEVYFRIALQL